MSSDETGDIYGFSPSEIIIIRVLLAFKEIGEPIILLIIRGCFLTKMNSLMPSQDDPKDLNFEFKRNLLI